jgi:HAD superfamily hydrolase (TIGR01509 family)
VTAVLQDAPDDRPAAVLWDLDGTLVDTEPYWFECEFALVEAHGGRWSEDHARALVGNALPETGRYIREHSGIDLSGEEIVAALIDGVTDRVRQHVPWRPGAAELLAALRSDGVRCALVTMSYRGLAEAIVSCLPHGSFEVLVTGDEVRHGKPHPEPYLVAAQRLGVDPAACLAIEDSPTGVASATAAGVAVLAVEHLVPIPPRPGLHVVRSLAGIGPADLAAWSAALSR